MAIERQEREIEAIGFFLPSLSGGGAERVVLTLAKAMVAEGHQVHLVLCDSSGPYMNQVPAGVIVVHLGVRRVGLAVPKLTRYLLTSRPKVLFSNLDHCNIVASIAILLARRNSRLTLVTHNTLSMGPIGGNGVKPRIIRWLMSVFYPMANSVVVVSKGAADDLSREIGLERSRISVIYNPFDLDEIKSRGSTAPKSESAQLSEVRTQKYFISVGRLTEQKDYPTLLDGYAEYVRQGGDAKLLILGEGPLAEHLQRRAEQLSISDLVIWGGFVENPYVYIKTAAALVLTSAWEGFGNVLVEALALDVRVIATNCPSGPSEILENGRWGDLVEVGDINCLAEKMSGIDSPRSALGSTRAKDFCVQGSVEMYLNVGLGRV
jgi:glycosyltransferase involved in cell wall biosynthesis